MAFKIFGKKVNKIAPGPVAEEITEKQASAMVGCGAATAMVCSPCIGIGACLGVVLYAVTCGCLCHCCGMVNSDSCSGKPKINPVKYD